MRALQRVRQGPAELLAVGAGEGQESLPEGLNPFPFVRYSLTTGTPRASDRRRMSMRIIRASARSHMVSTTTAGR